MKKILLIMVMFFAVASIAACDNGNDDTKQNGDLNNSNDEELREFTLDELSNYDGLDGRDAYVAVDGYVYDMTESSYWLEGSHQGRVQAGQDLSEEINGSPHGRTILDRVPKIGILLEE